MSFLSEFIDAMGTLGAFDHEVKVRGRKPVCRDHPLIAEDDRDGGLDFILEFTEECLGETDEPACVSAQLLRDQGLPWGAEAIRVPGSYLTTVQWEEEGDYWAGFWMVPSLVLDYPEEADWTTN